MPASALGVLFSRLAFEAIPDGLKAGVPEAELRIFLAKFPTLLVSLLLAAFVYLWAKQLYGVNAGFLAMSLYILDPNIMAHSRLVTQDVIGAFSIFAATYFFWNFLKQGGKKFALLSILMFGVAQVSRYTSVYLLPIFLILAVGFYGPGMARQVREKNFAALRSCATRFLQYSAALALAAVLIINLGFSFEKTFTRLGDYQFESEAFKSLQTHSEMLRSIPVPLPYSYLSGLDMGAYKRESGYGNGPTYLLGELGADNGYNKGFKEYYIVAFLYKAPLATQVLLVLAVIALFRRRSWRELSQNEAFLLVPCLFYFVMFSFFNAQLGIRYLLMIFPFLFVFASSVIAVPVGGPVADNRALSQDGSGARGRLLASGLVVYLLASNLSYFPHYLSYFNELLTDRTMGYKILADSNLDWGQNDNYIQQYLDQNPQAVLVDDRIGRLRLRNSQGELEPGKFAGGQVVISANDLLGVMGNPYTFEWLRKNRQPHGHVAYSHLLFEFQAEELDRVLNQSRGLTE
jgi:hypothetical protein